MVVVMFAAIIGLTVFWTVGLVRWYDCHKEDMRIIKEKEREKEVK